MRRWFLSYNSQDLALMQPFEAALRRKDAEAHIFFAPKSLRAGGYWLPELAKEIAEASAFVLLVGEKGLGPWQVTEYCEAIDRRVKEASFPVVLVLLEGQAAPGLPFLRQLHWIVTADPASEQALSKLMVAVAGGGTRPGELWRHTAPYRGLATMTEADSDFFFGRTREIVDVIRALEASPDRLPVLLGNSGVGKSSLAQAGALAALARQDWPELAKSTAGAWPHSFRDSRRWCYLTLRPGTEPIKALVDEFLRTWQFEATDPLWARRQEEWVTALLDGKLSLRHLLDATERRYEELRQPKPPAFFIYVDQGEELYVRAEQRQRARFSEILAAGLPDPRLRALMSLRADFSGALQNDEPLFEAYHRIEVPPLREAQLREVVSRPAELLSARFETDRLAADIACRTAEESTKDAGALPLLSYLLDDMWTQMVARDDGILRLPPAGMEPGGVLAERANAFLTNHPHSEEALQRLLTLNLATVREDGEPTRRRAVRSEFSDEEWRLVSDLADHPNRLLVTATPEGGETYAEVAHEAIFRRWDKLKEWIASEREFLAWKSGLEAACRAWQATPERSKNDALLMGFALAQAQSWRAKRGKDIAGPERRFIALSRRAMRSRQARVRALVGVLAAALLLGLAAWRFELVLREGMYWFASVRGHVHPAAAVAALKPREPFKDCAGCPEMVVVPAGSFMMGSPAGEHGRFDNEGPQRKIAIARPFAISRFEVTFAEWDACAAHGDCDPLVGDSSWGRGKQPLINVSWDDAKRYVAWLSRVTGEPYRLPTEAEWEYAARAGTTTAFSWGDEIGKGNANCDGCGSHWDNHRTAPAGSFAPNAFGLHEVHGNVWEWVEDCYHENYIGAPADSAAWTTGDCSRRVARGGSWGNLPRFVRSADRVGVATVSRLYGLGFRVVRTLDR
jgi:formylglycine-generating enzyme required for sulfatase activity